MDDVRSLKALQLDALREVANIGAGHAATALSQMTNRTIMIAVPEVNVRPLEEVPDLLGEAGSVISAVLMHMMGDLTGRALVIFPEPSARHLCDILLRRAPGTTTTFEAMEQSGLKEVGNILVSAYLTALSDFMGMMLVPSVPSLVVDQAGAILTTTYLNFGHDRDYVFCVETAFEVAGASEQLRGHFLLLPDLPSLRAIFDAIRVS
ncbi:MAG TPA: chemotaxis protein CheC [Gemmatimonadales bacterium]|nr:chemotaxis protein CheC [Gemmatimonadales bacterium]